MATSYGALCTDFYVNQKLALKMDLPSERETVLHFFDRVRKAVPAMDRFRRYDGELALESGRRDSQYAWLAMRRTSVRTGHVNPDALPEAYAYHKLILELAPFHLTISPLDVDYLELLFGFDLECKSDHDQVVYDALLAGSALGNVLKVRGAKMLDVQPLFGLALSEKGDLQAYFEVKTRTKTRRGSSKAYRDEPISIFLTLRRYGPFKVVEDLPKHLEQLTTIAEKLANERLVPNLLTPISRQIAGSNA